MPKSAIQYTSTNAMSIISSINNLLQAIDNDSQWRPRLTISSTHFITKNGSVHVRSIEKPTSKSRLQSDVDVFEVLSKKTLLEENNYVLSKVLKYPKNAAMEMEGFRGIDDWDNLKNHVILAANQGGTKLSTFSSHNSPSKE